MIKFYCDRCGKECEKLSEITIPKEKLSPGNFSTKTISVCSDCEKEAKALYDKLVDIRFILFKDFFRGNVSDGKRFDF